MNKRIIIKEFKMNSLNNRKKKVRIILPKKYFLTKDNYPVLYMHDGQNLVNKSPYSNYSWEVLKTMDDLGEMIIVGMDSHPTKRIQEYSPALAKNVIHYINKKVGVPKLEIKPEALEYGDFIITQVKPYIDSNFRTYKDRNHTFIAGSSCGGIISIYLGLKYQNIFSIIGAFSPAFWFVRKPFFDSIKSINIDKNIIIYHDMGTKENGKFSSLYIKYQKKFDELIRKKIPSDNVIMLIDKEAEHNEFYWSKRFQGFYSLCLENIRE